jgi:malonate transporter MadL subunit
MLKAASIESEWRPLPASPRIRSRQAIADDRRSRRQPEMIIYGTALLASCHLLGIFLGDLLGQALGVKTNVGGVGIAMLLLIAARLLMQKRQILPKLTELGVEYWGAMYIPVVVAMAAQQDMVAALRGGPVALLAAVITVAVCACVISIINRGERSEEEPVGLPVLHDNPLLTEAE